MRILYATSEVYPLIKTGGLADVSYSLPIALNKLGHDVKIILPFYRSIKEKIQEKITPKSCLFKGTVFAYLGEIKIYSSILSEENPIEVLLVDVPDLFDRDGGPYTDPNNEDWGDSAYRFAIYSRVVAMLGNNQLSMKWVPDLVHCNDWQTGLVIPLLQLEKNPPATLFTIHNLAYQGNFSKDEFDHLLLPEKWWSIEGLEFYGECSFLKAGVMNADWVTTVSPTYAKEVQTPEYGERFDGILQHRQDRFLGILNGVDYQQWNPETDPNIDFHFSAETIILKKKNKKALQKQLGLPVVNKIPMFGMICRMAYQKGVDLLIEALPDILEEDIQVVILGSGDIYYEAAFNKLQKKYPDKLSLSIGYNEVLSHKIEASSDFFLMPSRYEPCGLNQIYSLRYATLPIVRNTGGLADTVIDAVDKNISDKIATGIIFKESTAIQLKEAVYRAIAIFHKAKLLKQMRLTAMKQNFSWEQSSLEYEKLYLLAINKPKE